LADKIREMNDEQYQELKGKFKKEFASRCRHRGFERKENVQKHNKSNSIEIV
jgi:hypothetical protein